MIAERAAAFYAFSDLVCSLLLVGKFQYGFGPVVRQRDRAGREFNVILSETESFCKAAVRPLVRFLCKGCSEWICFNIPQDRKIVIVSLKRKTLKGALVNMSHAGGAVGCVPAVCMRYANPSHEFGQIAVIFGP